MGLKGGWAGDCVVITSFVSFCTILVVAFRYTVHSLAVYFLAFDSVLLLVKSAVATRHTRVAAACTFLGEGLNQKQGSILQVSVQCTEASMK